MPATFLPDQDPRPLTTSAPPGFAPLGLFVGPGAMGVEIAVYEGAAEPRNPDLRETLAARAGGRAAPVTIVSLWGRTAATAIARLNEGTFGPLVTTREQIERLAKAALALPDRHAASRMLIAAFGQLATRLPGIRNQGLFATHELETGVPTRPDWIAAGQKAGVLLDRRGRQLVERLGFQIQSLPVPGPASILVARGSKRAVAVFLDRSDEIDRTSPNFDGSSPISYALAKADFEHLDYVFVAAGAVLRVYPVKPGVGAGRRGRTETFVELNLDLLNRESAAYLWLLASAEALDGEGSFDAILKRSADYAAELGGRLRERVYEEVVPGLARALVKARRLRSPSPAKLRETYDMALLVLFRILFVSYAEDKELLPLHTNRDYESHSLKALGKRLQRIRAEGLQYEREDFLWTEVTQLWKAVNRGNKNWGVPAYNGGLFADDNEAYPGSAVLSQLSLSDRDFGPPLAALLLDVTPDGSEGPIDFRTLGVREFGTIYEGLLESELSVAESDLAVDTRGAYKKATARDEVIVSKGDVYLHNASGARKATGAYYTKPFAVEHLLDGALEPALTAHLERLEEISDSRAAADSFFDFRVADIAMGSGHFLVAAIDRIERGLARYLAIRPLPGVRDELERLRNTAKEALGEAWSAEPIEDTLLLRRQIARRCIFGVDLNPLAVELARLSVWIHTFVPGLPLSFLDGTLVVGNSLVGIATLDEAAGLIGAGSGDLFSLTAGEMLGAAREPLGQLALLAEATAAEVAEARRLYQKAQEAIHSQENLLTVLTASRIDAQIAGAVNSGQVATRLAAQGDVFSDALVRKAERALIGLHPFHFPIAFPQVFCRSRAGFDVIIGNPPWEEATIEEDAFWARHFPGLRGLTQREQERMKAHYRRAHPERVAELADAEMQTARMRRVLVTGPYPGMGTGDPDLYKAFAWRFWHLVAPNGGRIGVVLPRSALAAKGSTAFRMELFERSRVDVTHLLNTGGWVFDEAEPRYTIGLVGITRTDGAAGISLRGPYASMVSYRAGMNNPAASFSLAEIKGMNGTLSLPLLPSERAGQILAKLRLAPRLDLDDGRSWCVRPTSELHATNDKPYMDLEAARCPRGYWPVYKGESFDLWTPDTSTYYAWANPAEVLPILQAKRERSSRSRDSVFANCSPEWVQDPKTLPSLHARIAFRDVSRATDSRTIRCALIPPNVFLANTAPYLVWVRGQVVDQAFLLGALSSLVLDWYARRFVETHVNFFVFNPLPIPRPRLDAGLGQRVVQISARLATQDDCFEEWGREVGAMPGTIVESEKDDYVAELDAAIGHLYRLSELELAHVFETFHPGWDYQGRLSATLRHFHELKKLA